MDMEIYSIINTVVSVFLGGGWFLHWRASRRKANGEAKQTEAQANKEAQEYYNTTLADVNRTLNDVRAERDQYKSEADEQRLENREMRKKYNELEDKMTQIELAYKRDISRIGRRIDCMTPFLCSVAGCMNRRKLVLTDNIDDASSVTDYDNNSVNKDSNNNNKNKDDDGNDTQG